MCATNGRVIEKDSCFLAPAVDAYISAKGCGAIYMAARLGEVLFWAGIIFAALWLYRAFNEEGPKDNVALYVMPLFIVFIGWVLRYFLAGRKV